MSNNIILMVKLFALDTQIAELLSQAKQNPKCKRVQPKEFRNDIKLLIGYEYINPNIPHGVSVIVGTNPAIAGADNLPIWHEAMVIVYDDNTAGNYIEWIETFLKERKDVLFGLPCLIVYDLSTEGFPMNFDEKNILVKRFDRLELDQLIETTVHCSFSKHFPKK